MPDMVKGGFFVGAAVATGLLIGLLVPTLVGAENETAKKPRTHTSRLPTMPNVVGQRLDEAERELHGREISYVTNTPDILDALVPGVLEVCESEPAPGRSVQGSARLQAAVAGTCGI